MTQREAIETLIHHATRNVAGVGQGMRPTISEQEREKVRRAVKAVWRKAFLFDCTDGELRNLGL